MRSGLGHINATQPHCSNTTGVVLPRRGHTKCSSSRAPSSRRLQQQAASSSLQQQAAARSSLISQALPPSAPQQYSADASANEWSLRPVPVAARLLEIAAAFGSWWVRSKWQRDPQKAAADMREVRWCGQHCWGRCLRLSCVYRSHLRAVHTCAHARRQYPA